MYFTVDFPSSCLYSSSVILTAICIKPSWQAALTYTAVLHMLSGVGIKISPEFFLILGKVPYNVSSVYLKQYQTIRQVFDVVYNKMQPRGEVVSHQPLWVGYSLFEGSILLYTTPKTCVLVLSCSFYNLIGKAHPKSCTPIHAYLIMLYTPLHILIIHRKVYNNLLWYSGPIIYCSIHAATG